MIRARVRPIVHPWIPCRGQLIEARQGRRIYGAGHVRSVSGWFRLYLFGYFDGSRLPLQGRAKIDFDPGLHIRLRPASARVRRALRRSA